MRCYRARKYINEYLEGTLSSEGEASLRQHIEECGRCLTLLSDFETITRQAKELPKTAPSDRVLFNALSRFREQSSARAATPVRHLGWRPSLATASMVLASTVIILIAAGLFYYRPWKGTLDPEKAAIDQVTLLKLDEAQGHYEEAIKALSDASAAQHGNLDPEVKRIFQANLAVVEKSIEECRQAVKSDPRDMEAQSALMDSYKEKVQLMTELVAVQSTSEGAEASGSETESGIGL